MLGIGITFCNSDGAAGSWCSRPSLTYGNFFHHQPPIKDEVNVNCSECGKGHDGCVTEKHTDAPNRTES